jgi:ribosomal protein S12 methylthiotransferase
VVKVYLVTLGCPKNEVDSAGMAALLQQAGHTLVERPARADVLIVNTCGFIAPAREESLAEVQALAGKKRSHQALVAAGCMAGRYGGMLQAIPGVDALLPTERWAEIPGLVSRLARGEGRGEAWPPAGSAGTEEGGRRPGSTGAKSEGPCLAPAPHAGLSAVNGASAYLKIAEGCSARCAFCTIPQIKGPYRSFPREDLLAAARALVERGVREIVLVAQDTTFYGHDRGDQDGLPGLLEALLAAVPDLAWLRIMYTYPGHISSRLIEVMAAHPQVCPYLDIPLQHAHPATLRRMGRPADVAAVRALLRRLRERIPDIVLRTTFIVGYRGETEEEFAALRDFVQEQAFERVGVFPYYCEEGTAAAGLPDPVLPAVARQRRDELMSLQQGLARRWGQRQIGRTVEVLVEGIGEDGTVAGRTRWDAPEVDGLVLATGPTQVGKIVPVRITAASAYDLWGEVAVPA